MSADLHLTIGDGVKRRVRITQLDGALPNLALMRLASWHKQQGDQVFFERSARRHFDEPNYDVVYGSAIFKFTRDRVERFLQFFPDAIIGGTGTSETGTIERLIGSHQNLDYSAYPTFDASIGFTQRGCRLKCSFCVVPAKEGKPSTEQTLSQIWRGGRFPKKIHLLDNDFFSIKDWWQARIEEAREHKFKVSFTQGINVRVITDEVAAAIAGIEYRDNAFSKRRLYTAWDNIGEENAFFRGMEKLIRNGIPAKHVMAYMLVGYADDETSDAVMYRFQKMVDLGVLPYPMVFDCRETDPQRYIWLKKFQRWAVMGLYRAVPFSEYDASKKRAKA